MEEAFQAEAGSQVEAVFLVEVAGVAEEEASLVVVPAVAGNDKSKQKGLYMKFTKKTCKLIAFYIFYR